MADSNLNVPVIIQTTRLDTSILPRNIFSQSYLLYIIAQGTDVGNVANKANEAGQGAYDAQVRNDEQDVRLTTAEGEIVTLQADVSALDSRVTTAESNISALQDDYVSKTATATQSLASPLNVTTSYSVGGTKVIGARQTGWTAATGTDLRGSFNANQTYTVSATYTRSEVSAMATGLQQARQRIKALEDALRTHGLID
ncbi:TPA: phage tail protein [Escherichia coli]|nr:phage tail protein [Escherichia coli]HDD9201377.1 phage tail protein [Escherichia coli]